MPFPPEHQLRQIGPALDCLLALLDGDGLSETPVGSRPSIAMRVRAVIDAVLPAAIEAAVAERLPVAIKAASARHRAALDDLRAELNKQREEHAAQVAALATALAEQVQAAFQEAISALPTAELRAACDALSDRVDALPLTEISSSMRNAEQRLAALESAPAPVIVAPPAAAPLEVATLGDLITGQGDGVVTATVAAQYIAREINAAVLRAKG